MSAASLFNLADAVRESGWMVTPDSVFFDCRPLAAVLDILVFGRTQNVTNRNPVQHVYLDDEDSRGVRDGTDAREHRNCLPCHCVSAWTGFRHAKQGRVATNRNHNPH